MLVCDLCGGNNDVHKAEMKFSCKPLEANAIYTFFSLDICGGCTKCIESMVLEKAAVDLKSVLYKGLNLKPNTYREAMNAVNRASISTEAYYNK